MREFAAPSVLSSWTRTIVEAVAAYGVHPDTLLATVGISADAFRDPNGRLPLATTTRLWRAAVEHTGDPAFGLRASRHVRQTTFHALGYAVFASDTLRDALHRLVRYSRLVSDAATLRLESTEGAVKLSFDLPPPPDEAEAEFALGFESIDAVMSLIVRTCRSLTTRAFAPLEVVQRRPEPVNPAPYARFFRCPMAFDESMDAITFDPILIDAPLASANPDLADHNDDLVRTYLGKMQQGSVVDRARAVLAENLSGDASPAHIGAALGMSARSLQRRLQEHGTTYASLLTETRRDLALRFLRSREYSITEIAFVLGFEDSSAFARAFRRWNGISPSEYRAEPPPKSVAPPARELALPVEPGPELGCT